MLCFKNLNKKQVREKRKFCSHPCYSKNKIGEKHPWGYKIGDALRGKSKSKEHIKKVADANRGQIRPKITGRLHPNWKGGSYVQKNYVFLYKPSHPRSHRGVVAEHRLVVEESIGRHLNSSEIIHHINGNKLDNRIENLMITNRSEHARIHFTKHI